MVLIYFVFLVYFITNNSGVTVTLWLWYTVAQLPLSLSIAIFFLPSCRTVMQLKQKTKSLVQRLFYMHHCIFISPFPESITHHNWHCCYIKTTIAPLPFTYLYLHHSLISFFVLFHFLAFLFIHCCSPDITTLHAATYSITYPLLGDPATATVTAIEVEE